MRTPSAAPPATSTLERALLLRLVEREWGEPARRLTPLRGGMVARVYEVVTRSRELVLRISPSLGSLAKDAAVHARYSGAGMPVPAVHRVGRLDDAQWFAFADKAPGRRVDRLPDDAQRRLAPALAATLLAVHRAPVTPRGRPGFWTPDAPPAFPSWAAYLRDSTRDCLPRGRSAAEAGDVRAWHARFLELCAHAPDEAALLHGDFRFANLFARGAAVSGLIDWEESMYGDPLYDLAWLGFWHGARPVWQAYAAHPEGAARWERRARERLHAYQLRSGLRSLYFFERSGRARAYRWTLDRLRQVADGPDADPRRQGPAFFAPELES